jgi:hypothetical protein
MAPSTVRPVAGAGRRADVPETSRRWQLTEDRSAVLLVRVWLEDGTESFRARVTAVGTSGSDDRTVALAASTGHLLDAVSTWLDEFLRDGT